MAMKFAGVPAITKRFSSLNKIYDPTTISQPSFFAEKKTPLILVALVGLFFLEYLQFKALKNR